MTNDENRRNMDGRDHNGVDQHIIICHFQKNK